MVEKLLTERETADLLQVSPATLATWRSTERYPLKFIRCGRAVRYAPRDVADFIARRTHPGDGGEAERTDGARR